MRTNSDVAERMQPFSDLCALIGQAECEGAFEGLPTEVADYLHGMEPVGLNQAHKVVYPKSYKPENGPAVLVTLPRPELGNLYDLPRASRAEVEALGRIAAQATGRDHNMSKHLPPVKGRTIGWKAFDTVIPSGALLPEDDEHPIPRPVVMPRLLVVGPGFESRLEYTIGSVGQELAQWDFYLNEQGRIQGSEHALRTVKDLLLLGEKRGYQAAHRIYRNLGHVAVEEPLKGRRSYDPTSARDALELVRDDIFEKSRALNPGLTHSGAAIVQAAVELVRVFGDEENPLTAFEYLALGHLREAARRMSYGKYPGVQEA